MFKQIITLFRGVANQSAEDFTDRHALAILKQQMNDCSNAIMSARKAVGIAIAQNEQEIIQHKRILARIEDLEQRTIAALEQDKKKLAHEAAETIALLETECDATKQAQKLFTTEIDRLKKIVRSAEIRLRELKRGQRIATATDQTQRLREAATGSGLSTLIDAEETLLRLRVRQQQIDTTASAIAEMEQSGDPERVIKKLAEAGCGSPQKTSAEDVLARLKKKTKKSA
ncbi:MAG: PspA family regulator [Hyphomicrobiales bacterium]|nr:MAG: PspA family regulator [Hyphomicrobiales bacterium]